MRGQLLPLRLLSTSVSSRSFSEMKLGASSFQSSRETSFLNRVFPFKMKYMGFSRKSRIPVLQNEESGIRRFSSRSLRSRNGGSSGMGGRNLEGGECKGGSFGGRGGQSKSLVEDEAELSDWISELKTKSLRVGLSSESDDSDRDRDRDRNRNMDRGRGRKSDSFSSMRNQRGGRDGFSNSKRWGESDDSDRDMGRNMDRGRGRGRGRISDSFSSMRNQRGGRDGFSSSKRQRDSGSDDFSVNSRRNTRNTDGSFSRNPRGSMSGPVSKRRVATDSEEDEGEELYSRRNNRGSRGTVSSPMKRSGRDSDFSYGRGRGGGNFLNGRKGPGRQALLASEDDDEEEKNEEFSPRRRDRGSRGVVSSPMKRSGRDSNLSNGSGRGGGNLLKGVNGSGRKALLTSEDEDDDEEEGNNLMSGFEGGGNLLKGVKGSGRQALLTTEDEDDDDEEVNNLMSGVENFVSEEDSGDDDEDVLKDGSSIPGSAKEVSAQMTPRSSTGKTDSYLSQTRFDQCSISPLSLKGIKDAGYERMTVVQEATLPVILKGKDVLAKAKTGTGKTVAFLLPSIEVIVKSPPVDRDQKRPPICVLIICPTRELASQAAAEANNLLKYHPSLGVQVVIGGTRLTLEQKRMQANPCQILVATPGRLKDHIENTAGFATRLMGVKVLILDEADHLLDMGFRKDIEKIIAAVPKQRQTLLFSATVPEEVRQVCHFALKRDHEFINTVEEGSEETHSQVRQMNLVAPLDKHFSLLYVILKEHITDDVDYKVLVFCTTAMVTKLVAGLLSELNLNVREIHSRKPQSYRTRVSDEFRKSKGLILVTSDVSARGVDYPDVTLVIQVGVPADREQYIHRLGRTGRKGKEGQGILLLAPWEEFFLSTIKDLPIAKASVPSVDPDTRKKVEKALSHVEMKSKETAYQAWLGYYNSIKSVARDKCRLVELANEFSRSMGLDNPPAIPKLILGKMGLRNVPGLRSK